MSPWLGACLCMLGYGLICENKAAVRNALPAHRSVYARITSRIAVVSSKRLTGLGQAWGAIIVRSPFVYKTLL